MKFRKHRKSPSATDRSATGSIRVVASPPRSPLDAHPPVPAVVAPVAIAEDAAMADAARLGIVNPATGEALREVPCDSQAAIDAKIERARAARRSWRHRPLSERLSALA